MPTYSDSTPPKVTLIGAGLSGPLLALFLAQRGFAVDLYERRPDMRKTHLIAGRSINLALSHRGIRALRETGVEKDIMKSALPMKGRMMHSVSGGRTFQPYGKDDSEVIYSLSRAQINIDLMNLAEATSRVQIHFNERCTHVDVEKGIVFFTNEETGQSHAMTASPVIGTDGSASALRQAMLVQHRFNYAQEYPSYGYKELTIPPGPHGEHCLDKNALHIWPRKTYMLIALPNIDGSFTATLFLPFEGHPSFESLKMERDVLAFFHQHFPDAISLLPTLAQDFFDHPTGSLVTIKCFPWHVGNRALLLGDAAHAMVPFFGQGMNCAFEDIVVFGECLKRFPSSPYKVDWEELFIDFERRRKVNTDAISDLAYENFIEMRDRVADPAFLLKKEVERLLEKKYPQRFIPQYAMVTFHPEIPYSIALSRGKIQDQILSKLCNGLDRPEDLDESQADWLIQELPPLSFPPEGEIS